MHVAPDCQVDRTHGRWEMERWALGAEMREMRTVAAALYQGVCGRVTVPGDPGHYM